MKSQFIALAIDHKGARKAIIQSCWRMKHNGRLPKLGCTDELQDFISDLHSYPAVLYIP